MENKRRMNNLYFDLIMELNLFMIFMHITVFNINTHINSSSYG